MPLLAPLDAHWEADWQVRATCEFTPCGSTNWSDSGGDGACCFPGACCTESLTEEDCGTAGGIYLSNGDCNDCLVEQRGVCCIGNSGPLTQDGFGSCVEGLSQTACELAVGGTWFSGLDHCTDGVPCAPWAIGDACCIQGICLNVSEADCNLAGGRVVRGQSCGDAGVCAAGVCCVDGVQMPGTNDPGLAFEAITEARCSTWGGRWIGSGGCIFSRAFNGADINGDGRVNAADLVRLLAQWGRRGGPEDIDGDGRVGLHDLMTLVANWAP
jgi:hypothetical protein